MRKPSLLRSEKSAFSAARRARQPRPGRLRDARRHRVFYFMGCLSSIALLDLCLGRALPASTLVSCRGDQGSAPRIPGLVLVKACGFSRLLALARLVSTRSRHNRPRAQRSDLSSELQTRDTLACPRSTVFACRRPRQPLLRPPRALPRCFPPSLRESALGDRIHSLPCACPFKLTPRLPGTFAFSPSAAHLSIAC